MAEALSKNWRFKLHVFLLMFATIILSVAVISGFYGWTVRDQFNKANFELNKLIQQEFQKDSIKRTIQQVADNKAAQLIQNYIEPSIANSKKKIEDFNQHLNEQKIIATKDISILQQETNKLQERNNITSIADKAIGQGDLHAFQKLKKMDIEMAHNNAAVATELNKVYAAYSVFAPSKWESTRLNASSINRYKFDDEELSVSELLTFLNNKQPEARVRAANLLINKSKWGSYSTAKAVIEAIKKEDNLIVIHSLNGVFARVTGYSPNQPDGSDALEWWREQGSNFAKKDTDRE